MRRVAVFVDAGYFWVQTAQIIFGGPAQRNQISIDYGLLRQELLTQTKNQFPSVDILRAYWYDGPGPNGKTTHHHAIENLDDFKLRLGTRNGVGAQKAVDGLIIADMIGLAQSKAISDALLISGDADLTPGVIAAQNLGIRVHLLSMGSTAATSPYLRSEVDFKHHWDDAIVKTFATTITPVSTTVATPVPAVGNAVTSSPVLTSTARPPAPASVVAPAKALQDAAVTVRAGVDAAVVAAIGQRDPIPKDIDGKLLSEARKLLGRSLDEQEKRQARIALRKLL